MSKHIDAEAFKRRILSYGIVHEGDRIPIPFYKRYLAEAYVAMLRWVCEEVDDTPDADTPRWIPVTERLPEEHEEVLTYNSVFGITFDSIHNGKWRKHPEAWMPLPEPYKGGEEE